MKGQSKDGEGHYVDNKYEVDLGERLFSTLDLRTDDVIAEFHGEYITKQQYIDKRRVQDCKYVIRINNDLFLDCESNRFNGTCKASLSNSPSRCIDITTSKRSQANCKLIVYDRRAYLKAIKDIPRCTEICWHYGKSHSFN